MQIFHVDRGLDIKLWRLLKSTAVLCLLRALVVLPITQTVKFRSQKQNKLENKSSKNRNLESHFCIKT